MECGWSQSQQCCEERPLQRGQTSTDMSRGNSSCKEDECKKDFSTFDGRTTGCAEAVTKKTARKKHRLYRCPHWRKVRNQILEHFGKWEQQRKTSNDDCKWHKGITSHPLSRSNWKKKPLVGPQVGIG